MLEELQLNECLSFSLIYECVCTKAQLLEGKFLDEVVPYSLSDKERQALQEEYRNFWDHEFIDQNNRILVSNFLYLILKKIQYEQDITILEFNLCEKIFDWHILAELNK